MKQFLSLILILIFSISYADDIKIVTKEIKDSSIELRYHTSGKYPQLDGMKDEDVQKKINKEIYETMKRGIDDFKIDMAEWDLSSIPDYFNSELEYSYTSYTLTDDLFSFAFGVYSFYAGSAHPNHWTISMNFDLKNGMKIAFKDLFNPKVKYLEKISTYCIKDLKLQGEIGGYVFDEEMLNEGAGPKDSNFMNFNILQKGLQISFDPYQVGPYVMGEHCVIIPYKALYEIINQEGVLSKFDY